MYNVLLADDEAVMRIALRKMLDWEASGFRLAAAVSNGAEALAYIRANPVDIVLTDLRMPVMDGLDLIQALNDDGFTGAILVLSNYADFELVRTALTSGAVNYMLKLDIDGDKLRKQLSAAAAQVVEKSGPQKPRTDSYYPCFLSIRHIGVTHDTNEPARRALVIIEQMFAETGAEIELMSGKDVFLLIPVSEPGETAQRVMDKLQQTVRQIQVYLSLSSRALIVETSMPLEQARGMYPEFEQASRVFFYTSLPEVQYLDDLAFRPIPKSFDPVTAASGYVSAYYGQGGEQAGAYLSGLMDRLASVPVLPVKAIEFFRKAADMIAFAFPAGSHTFTSDDADIKIPDNTDAFLAGLCARLSGVLDNSDSQLFKRYEKYRKEVRDALLFVHFHYQESITLDDVAKSVSLNRDYLCRLFNRETGSPMFRYINSLRMRRAASLITIGNAYMSAVASAVGMSDQFYFARVFKKYHGISPSEYGKKAARGSM